MNIKITVIACALIACLPASLMAGYAWVSPGEYQFGSCGYVNGGVVPSVIRRNERYTSRFSCNSAYGHGDICLDHARKIEFALNRYGTLGQCSDWLKRELAECRNHVRGALRHCSQLEQ